MNNKFDPAARLIMFFLRVSRLGNIVCGSLKVSERDSKQLLKIVAYFERKFNLTLRRSKQNGPQTLDAPDLAQTVMVRKHGIFFIVLT